MNGWIIRLWRAGRYVLELPAIRAAGVMATWLILLALGAGYVLALWKMPDLMYQHDAKDRHNARLLVVSTGGAIVVAVSLLYTARSYRLSHRGQVTDRFTKALERLSSDDIEARLGGIHALEHVARDSRPHHDDVVEVLEAFIASRAPANIRQDNGPNWLYAPQRKTAPPSADIRAALTALTNRPHRPERRKIDLRGLRLNHADLTHARLARAILRGTDLTSADLTLADLRGANLRGANLRGATLWSADLSGANLTGAGLRGANLTGADLWSADLRGANLTRAILRSAYLANADLRGAYLRDADLTDADLTDADLTRANLRGSGLRNADLARADLRDADLCEADLTGADLNGADLDRADLRGVWWSEGTVWPDSVGGTDGMRARSEPVEELGGGGVFRVVCKG